MRTYYLRDDLGRIVGQAESERRIKGVIEYGSKIQNSPGRPQDGYRFHVQGMARMVTLSSLSRGERERLTYDPPRKWDW
jgi:hypothetical protein